MNDCPPTAATIPGLTSELSGFSLLPDLLVNLEIAAPDEIKVTNHGVSPPRSNNHGTSGHRVPQVAASGLAMRTFVREPGRSPQDVVPCDRLQIKACGKGWAITAGFADSPFGRCLLAQSPRSICRLSFPDPANESREWTALQEAWPLARLRRDDDTAARLAASVFAESSQALHILVQGSPFQIMVWQALLRIPCGTTLSYGQLAAAIGRPTAVRAVAGAVARNPIAFLIPCHRVLPASGGIGGYRWGQARKGAILAWEKARQPRPGTPP